MNTPIGADLSFGPSDRTPAQQFSRLISDQLRPPEAETGVLSVRP